MIELAVRLVDVAGQYHDCRARHSALAEAIGKTGE